MMGIIDAADSNGLYSALGSWTQGDLVKLAGASTGETEGGDF